MTEKRALPDGGYRQDEKTAPALTSATILRWGARFSHFMEFTGGRDWLVRIDGNFEVHKRELSNRPRLCGGQAVEKSIPSKPQREENAQLARYANLLHHYTGDAAFRASAEHAMKYLSGKTQVDRKPASTLLLVDHELGQDPLHVTVVERSPMPPRRRFFSRRIRYPRPT